MKSVQPVILSVTVMVVKNEPTVGNVCTGFDIEVVGLPSPKFQSMVDKFPCEVLVKANVFLFAQVLV